MISLPFMGRVAPKGPGGVRVSSATLSNPTLPMLTHRLSLPMKGRENV